jgi:hypothetical protein
MLQVAITIYAKNKSAYRELENSGIVIVSSTSTLQKYYCACALKPGCMPEFL